MGWSPRALTRWTPKSLPELPVASSLSVPYPRTVTSPDVEKQYNLAPYTKSEGGDYRARFPNVNEAKVIRKIDIRVIPVLCVLYLLAFLDR